jgi:predicted hydrocarbon binding protein
VTVQETNRLHVQGLMVFLASLSHGLENALGRSATGVMYCAGKSIGLKRKVEKHEPDDLLKAFDVVWEEMLKLGMKWGFEPWKPAAQTEMVRHEDGRTEVQLVFRNCMVRSSLFRYGHAQKLSLCQMNYGLFCGLLEQVHGCKADLEILYAGENACLKRLTVQK